ncbi:MAG: RCC1 domain-containing protein [Sandaracinaceae bacterium]
MARKTMMVVALSAAAGLAGCTLLNDRFMIGPGGDAGAPVDASRTDGGGPRQDAGGPPAPCTPLQVVQLAPGTNHTCVRHSCGAVSCWGDGSAGQLGDGRMRGSATPVFVEGVTDAVDLFSGDRFACVVRSDGTVWCWGANDNNMIGDGGGSARGAPTLVRDVGDAERIAHGSGRHVCAGTSAGPNVWCWGDNAAGQLGNGTMLPSTTPTEIDTAIGPVVSLATSLHSCAVRGSDHALYCWGGNGLGELGDGSRMPQPSPLQIPGITAQRVAAGNGFTCIVDDADDVRCWGTDRFGELGDGGSMDVRSLATDASVVVGGVAELVAGESHVCALAAGGYVTCWGRNNRGQLGLGAPDLTSLPQGADGLSDIVTIGSGGSHVCALRDDLAVFCWGSNDWGQLGDGTTDDQLSPVRVIGLRNE